MKGNKNKNSKRFNEENKNANDKNNKNNKQLKKYERLEFTCTKCYLIPELINIDFNTYIIKLKCINHKINQLSIIEYLDEIDNNIKQTCELCNKTFIKIKNNLKYCINCNVVLCLKCVYIHKNNEQNHLIINIMEQNNKCRTHLGDNFISFCNDCNMNICLKCTEDNIHLNHKIIKYNEIIPNKKDIDYIKNKFKIKKNNINYNDINIVVLNDIIINTFNRNKQNYNSIINMKKYLEIIKDTSLLENNDIKIKNAINKFSYIYNIDFGVNDLIINLKTKDIGNEGLKTLCSIQFSQLKEIILVENDISDINALRHLRLYNLKILNLSYNKISNISILSKLNLVNVQQLHLDENNISDISPLTSNVNNFTQLKKLFLSFNNITDISIFSKGGFLQCLKELHLNNNNIKDISVLKNNIFNQLQKLVLHHNQIEDISPFKTCNLYQLQELYLNDNYIINLDGLNTKNNIFDSLQKLYLNNNNIVDLNSLNGIALKNLQKIFLSDNKIKNIKGLLYINCPSLIEIDLSKNVLEDIQIIEKIDFFNVKKLGILKNKFKMNVKNKDLINNLKLNDIKIF